MEEAVAEAHQAAEIDAADLEELRPTLIRIARVAKYLFGAATADVTLDLREGQWRASNFDGPGAADPASRYARQMDGVLWIEQILDDPRFNKHPMVVGKPHLRFYAGASINLEDGTRIGALGVYDPKPHAYNAKLAARLQDLAHVVAHEFDRVRAVRERQETLERVAQSEQRLKIATHSAQLHVYEINYRDQTTLKVGSEESLFQRPQSYSDLQGFNGVFEEDRPNVQSAWKRHSRTGEPFRCEYRLNLNDGREVWVANTSEVIRDAHGKPLRLISSLQNITDRKKAEVAMVEAVRQAETANVAKSAFLATMSHEIRTPLNGVLGMAQAMAADSLEPVQRERLDVIRQSGEALLAILNDILDLSKIEAGRLDLEEIEFDLGEIALGAHAAFTALANKKGVSFDLQIGEAAGVYRGDPTRLRQILYNLISNALKFTEVGEIRVQMLRTGEGLSLTVSDTGIGMSEEVVANLFTKFGQADASTTRKYGGSGLGLAICRELSKKMGGTIAVASTPGEGSTFTVTLPMVWVAGPALTHATPADQPADEEEDGGEALELRVLAAEDNPINQLVLKTLLHQMGIDPVVVENGAEAVSAWEGGAFDLILMDVQMPVMDGPSATRAIRKAEAETGRAPVPIIALTANAMSHQIADYLAAGMDGHVAKPIEATKLFAVLEMAAERMLEEHPQAA